MANKFDFLMRVISQQPTRPSFKLVWSHLIFSHPSRRSARQQELDEVSKLNRYLFSSGCQALQSIATICDI